MRIAVLGIAGVLLVASPAAAYQDDFIGWSADGTWYVMTSSGTDEMPVPMLCLSKPGTTPPTWPKKVPVPEADVTSGCTDRWDMMFPDEGTDAPTQVKNATKLVVVTKPSDRGPGGETFTLKRAGGATVEVAVSRKGKRIARGFFELKYASTPLPNMVSAYWRKDGGAVAVTAGWAPDPRQTVGFGPPSYLVVLPLDGSTADAKSRRQQAADLNVEGMKALTAKKLDEAQKKFEDATNTDETFLLAYYNLACAASLRHDSKASISALKVLDASDAKEAKEYLTKGLTDHDLDFIAQDPEGAKLLKRKPPAKK
jgi:hypothetical protein